ncbi:outer membrane protein assembly factor BamA [Flavobacterium enshiense]|uniref:Outer membrane protein assembly factor BamA n=1 Tax=Flavobacterium enshiense DK69 TaxID=1107311 RepID=A0A0A2N7W3_9FLAO|nr:outer membrane protein assembly factor BamA [Flavobacterium enshiense]KGO96545.1 membrane protein [Flavobacterium enshiense DK69]
MTRLSVIKKENEDLEKQVNKLNNFRMFQKTIRLVFAIIFLGSISTVNAQDQDNNTPEAGKKYVLANVDVTGKITYNQQTIVTFSGLEKGETITVPGDEISSAIKKLWKLGLFNDINFYVEKIQNDSIFLELNINELPKLNEVKFQGVKKGKVDDLIKDNDLKKDKVVNENLLTTTKNYIENKYKKDGYYNTKVTINTIPDSTENKVNMVVNVDRGKKVKIKNIVFEGNSEFTTPKLKRTLSNTKEKSIWNPMRIYKSSKFIKDKYNEDLVAVIDEYKENGYRDARITDETVTYDKKKNTVDIKIKLEEGKKYYFGDIRFLGNTVYNNQHLEQILGIKKGDVYNGKLLQERIADKSRPDGEDLTNEYQNNGYLFSNINAVEVKTANDTIDFEIRITEGPIAYFNKVTITGNDRTNDHVIYRELRTKPGQKWSKDNVIRSIRELGQLGFFDPEALKPDVKPNGADGTVDINYNVAEKGSSQVELQGGYGGGGFIGTLGLSFNNFSIRNLFNKEAYKPLPMGDGQKMALRLQGSSYFQTYSLSFTEPWLGGKKPVSFSTSLSHSKQYLYNYSTRDVTKEQSFTISAISVGMAKKLTVPDDYFILSQSVSFQYYNLHNYFNGLFTFGNGDSRNLTYTVALSRNSKGFNPIYPTYGSEFTLTGKFTLPYSLFNGVDYGNLGNLEENKLKNADGVYLDEDGNQILDSQGNPSTDYTQAAPDQAKVDQIRFKWLEYYKIKFKADWYTKVYEKLVLRTLGEFGFLGAYNQERGLVPFERFYLGGDGLANFSMDGREVIQLRGYPNQSLAPIIEEPGPKYGQQVGATVFNKFSLELRYPITLAQSASIYALTFAEAGASFDSFKNYTPFSLKRSAGVGLRVFMPAFGLLGIDFAHGFDAIPGQTQKSGWQTHFIIGQQF